MATAARWTLYSIATLVAYIMLIAAANTTTGQHTKAMIAERREAAKSAKGLRDRLRVAEQNLRRHGIID